MNKIIEYVIGAKDATGNAIKSAVARIRSFAESVGRNLTNIKSGFDMMAGVVRRFSGVFIRSITEAFKFEKAYANFAGLLNSMKKAKEHVAELQKFASSTPLTFDDLQGASKLLLSFGESVDKILPSLKMLGDISMGDRQKFQGLALVFAQVKSAGKLMGQDLLQMINQGFNPLTIMAEKTGKTVSELKDIMSKGGITFDMVAESMRLATSEGGLFNNAMKNAATTGEGLMSTLEDNWIDALRTFGKELMDVAKGGIQWCINKLQELKESGTITEWAKKAKNAINTVVGAFSGLTESATRAKTWEALKDVVIGGFEEGATAAANILMKTAQVVGKLISDALVLNPFNKNSQWSKEVEVAKKMGYKDIGFWDWTHDNKKGIEEVRAEIQRQKLEQAQKEYGLGSVSDGSSSRFQRGIEALKKLGEEAVARANKIDETAVQSSEKEKTEYKKVGDLKQMIDKAASATDEKERLKAEKAIARERERQWKEHVAQIKKDYSDLHRQSLQADKALADAVEQEKKVWGWYRDKDAWKAQLQEERDEAAAQKQFDKDFEKLKDRKRDWRTAKLSDEDEIVRRVALAREEKAAAEEYARTTAIAAEAAAEALANIQSTLEGE